MAKRKPTISGLKKKAWKLCSEYVRRSNSDENGFSSCISCDIKMPWNQLQAGHLISGRGNSILFDLRGIYPQCYSCNCCKNGNVVAYLIRLEQKLGKKEANNLRDELYYLSKKPRQFSIGELEDIVFDFKQKIARLNGK